MAAPGSRRAQLHHCGGTPAYRGLHPGPVAWPGVRSFAAATIAAAKEPNLQSPRMPAIVQGCPLYLRPLFCTHEYGYTPRMGRKPKPPANLRANILRIRLTVAERAALDQAAQVAGDDTSTWARQQ